MKIVIDIPGEEYNECKNRFDMVCRGGYLNDNLYTALVMYVALGKPIKESEEEE